MNPTTTNGTSINEKIWKLLGDGLAAAVIAKQLKVPFWRVSYQRGKWTKAGNARAAPDRKKRKRGRHPRPAAPAHTNGVASAGAGDGVASLAAVLKRIDHEIDVVDERKAGLAAARKVLAELEG